MSTQTATQKKEVKKNTLTQVKAPKNIPAKVDGKKVKAKAEKKAPVKKEPKKKHIIDKSVEAMVQGLMTHADDMVIINFMKSKEVKMSKQDRVAWCLKSMAAIIKSGKVNISVK